jgi:hypothetical protein
VGLAAPVLALLDLVEPIAILDRSGVHVAGAGLAAVGIAATLYARVARMTTWRIGVARPSPPTL